MSRKSIESDKKAVTLRHDAESRLTKGSAPQSRGVPLGREALALLFEMAGDATRSSDALRLLQELQVHQVELDLQREELENSEHEMRVELARYKAIFELTPTMCLVITREGRIIEANAAAGTILKTCEGELEGRTLNELVKHESQAVWLKMLETLSDGGQAANCEVVICGRPDETVTLQLSGGVSAEGEVLLFGVVH